LAVSAYNLAQLLLVVAPVPANLFPVAKLAAIGKVILNDVKPEAAVHAIATVLETIATFPTLIY